MPHYYKLFFLVGCSFSLIGCGGSSSETPTTEPVLSVNAGVDQTVDEKLTFDLKATATPEGGEYTWTQLSGPVITGFPLTGASQSVIAPDIKNDSQLVFSVEYRTSNTTKVSDTVAVNIRSINQLPVVSISQTGPTTLPSVYGDTITLSSSASFDPDENGHLATYLWQQTQGDPVTLSDTNSADLSFSHPLLEFNNQTQFSLTITDDEGGEQTNSFDLLLLKTNKLVLANAGENQTAQEFTRVQLDGSQSQVTTDTFSCAWQQLDDSGVATSVTIENPELCQTQFVVPDIDGSESLTFELTVTDEKKRTATDQVQVAIKPKPLGLLNDTGMVLCFDNTSSLSDCQNDDFPGQDAQRGRDQYVGLIDKVGQGEGGFDFTKLDQFAGELPDTASSFSCVRDNVTGLIWEIKQPSIGTLPNTTLREAQNRYSWFSSDDNNGGVEGVESPPLSSCPSIENCGLEKFVEEVNLTNYCGGNNWRVPNHDELLSLLNYSYQGSGNLLPSEFFPNSPDVTTHGNLIYWTMQTSAEGAQLNFVWAVDMASGNDLVYPKSNMAYIRLVRNP